MENLSFRPSDKAIENVVKTYSNMLFKLCFTMLRNNEDAEDAVSDVFLKYISASMKFADESGNSVEKFKSVSFGYEKNGDRVIFSQDKFNSELDTEGEIISSVSGTDIYYFSYTNKFVPPDYKITDEDKKAEENGELVFSYGSSEVKICEIQSVTWRNNDIQYQLMQIDGKLSADDLVSMAEEIINN